MSGLFASRSRRLGVVQGPQAYVISYPKTGRTWLRTLVGKYLVDAHALPESSLLDTESLTAKAGLRRTTLTHDGSEMVSSRKFADLDPDKSKYAEANVLLLGRNIHDTMVSAYFQATRRVDVFDGTISEFVRSDRFGVQKFITFYEQWIAGRNTPKAFLFLRYESIHDDPVAALSRSIAFLGEHDVNYRAVASSVEYCSFDNLRKAEGENRFGDGILRPADATDPESYKVRRGIVGGFRDYLSEDDVAYIDAEVASAGFDFGKFDE